MYTVILESLDAKSDLRAIVGAMSNVLGTDKKGAVEKAKNLPVTLAQNLPEKEAKLMADMFNNYGAGIKVVPPLDNYERPIRDFKTELNRGLPIGCVVVIVLCMIGFAAYTSMNYEWIKEQLKPSPEKSIKLLKKGEIKSAKKSIQSQLKTKPDDIGLWVLLGQANIMSARKRMNAEHWKSYGEAGAIPELDSAIALFRKAESMNPKDGSIARWISITEQMRQNLPEAEIAARRAVAISPSDADNWNQLGSVQVDLEDIGQAEQTFYSILKNNPGNANALKNLTILNLYHLQEPERAAKFLFAFLTQKEAETDMDTYQMRTDLTTAMIGNFNHPWEKLSPPKIPFEDYERRRAKISAFPGSNNDPLAQEQLGLLFLSKGDLIPAEACFIKAVNLGNSEPSRKMLAIMYMKAADYAKALKVMQAAVQNNNTRDPFFWKNIGVLQKYFKADPIEASKAFNRYIALGGDSFSEKIKSEMR
jgi:tetratricopeptide (TPR) repeat protein